jgi:hypothetical protein
LVAAQPHNHNNKSKRPQTMTMAPTNPKTTATYSAAATGITTIRTLRRARSPEEEAINTVLSNETPDHVGTSAPNNASMMFVRRKHSRLNNGQRLRVTDLLQTALHILAEDDNDDRDSLASMSLGLSSRRQSDA